MIGVYMASLSLLVVIIKMWRIYSLAVNCAGD